MNNGFAIALAWPETLCKQAGGWYDGLMHSLSLSKKGYYKVGHAAIILISDDAKVCEYYDFGRYHAPYQHGRVRSVKNDFDLEVKTKAEIDTTKSLTNLSSILKELQYNESCHGDGKLYATVSRVDYNAASKKAQAMQNREFILYGPFVPNGTNCSRFVSSVLKAGKLKYFPRLKLQFPLMLSPTPMWNLRATDGDIKSYPKPFVIIDSVKASKINKRQKHDKAS